MNFPLYIAKRYLRSKSSQNAVNIINFITFLVIVIGAAALFIVLSGFAGLKTFSLSFSNTFDPDLKAIPATGKFFRVSADQEEKLQEVKGVASFSKEIEEKVSLSYKQKNHIAYIKGVDANYPKTNNTDSILYFGEWNLGPQTAVAGIGIASILGLTVNDFRSPFEVLAFKPGKGSLTPQGFNSKPYNDLPLVLSGVYQIELDLDRKYVFADLPLVQALLEKDPDQFSSLNFKLGPDIDENRVRSDIAGILGKDVLIRNRKEQNTALYRMLNTENMATYLIFTLVLIIALFNVVGAIIMMILDKQQNSRTLYSLGTTVGELRRVYFLQGLLVTCLGGLIGVLIGSMLIVSQKMFGWLKITPSLAYPVEFQLVNVLIVLATIGVLGTIASLIASSRINKTLVAYN